MGSPESTEFVFTADPERVRVGDEVRLTVTPAATGGIVSVFEREDPDGWTPTHWLLCALHGHSPSVREWSSEAPMVLAVGLAGPVVVVVPPVPPGRYRISRGFAILGGAPDGGTRRVTCTAEIVVVA